MDSSLRKLREANRADVESALAEAEERKEILLSELQDLEEEIRLAEAWLGRETAHVPEAATDRHTLHDAMKIVLEEQGDAGMMPSDLAKAVTDRGLYRMRDGRPTSAHQVQARVNNYPKLFVRESGRIRLRKPEEGDD